MFGRKDFHTFNPKDFICEDEKFNSVLEYLDIEASRSRILLTSTKQGKKVNDICLHIHDSLKAYGAEFTMNIEAIYKMAVIRLVAINESVDQVLMPIFKQNLDTIAEVEVFPETLDSSIILVFIDNVFEEVTPDDAIFFLEHDEYTKWIEEPVEEDPIEFEESEEFENFFGEDNS